MGKIVCIIPARWASTRFPGKPLSLIAGKPLVQHVWEKCSSANQINRVIVATDDMRIAEAAFDFGAEVAMTSPKHPTGTDRIAEVAKHLSGVSHVINVQGDEPLVDPKLVDRLAKTLRADPKLAMATAASLFTDGSEAANPNNVKVVLDCDSNALYFSRCAIPFVRGARAPVRHLRHHGIYGYTHGFLLQFVKWKPTPLERAECLEQLRALEHGAKIRVLMARRESVGVDVPEDVKLVEGRLKAGPG